ncbi:hypothetical protein AcV5_000937 [Taiwanofungus camphoratus]|nr:hypothetical protein AcV5_000937 [Antrodia cinnamomea]
MLRKRILPVFVRPSCESTVTPMKFPEFPTDVDIRPHMIRAQDDGSPKLKPRGTGKLLSSTQGVGLALLRLEHAASLERGDARLEFEIEGDERTKWRIAHWWPDWWPSPPSDQE